MKHLQYQLLNLVIEQDVLKDYLVLDLILSIAIQLIEGNSNRYEGRVQEISEITQGLKALA